MAAAGASPVLAGMRIEGMPDAAQVKIVVDREKANTFGVTFADTNTTLSTNPGSTYVNDFPTAAPMQRGPVQAGQRQPRPVGVVVELPFANGPRALSPGTALAGGGGGAGGRRDR